ncbi:MAG: tetratricopeptide repeat protein [Sphingomonadaceae bacterium]|nr:MAG: tetratricopeptide repeat protein [Sphingomonadaceae bacterium]
MALTPSNTPPSDKKANQKLAADDALLREVDDAVRQDQYSEFGRRYGVSLVAVLVLGLAAFGGYLWWDGQREGALEKDGEALISAMDQIEAGNLKTANEALGTLADDDNVGARSAALLLQGGVLSQQGDSEGAARVFGRLASDPSAPPAYRDLALIRLVHVQFDTMDPAEVISRLKPVAVRGNPYFGSAGELVGMAYLEQGKRKEAGTLFSQIAKDDDVPQSIRSRARQMAGVLGVDAIEDVDKVLEEAGANTGASMTSGAPAEAG